MHAQPPRTLKRLLKQYGQELIDDPRRTEALLRDLCGQHVREIFVLVNAQKQRVPNELLAAPAWMPRQAVYSRLSRNLQTKLALTEDAADWAVTSWAAALDLDSLPKGETWSWLPGKARTPATPKSRKSRSKKRQNSSSRVQYTKTSASKSVRQAKERSARAELSWTLPFTDLSRVTQLAKMPSTWVYLLPWLALITATVFLLAVVYWTSSARNSSEANSPTQSETELRTETASSATAAIDSQNKASQNESGAALPSTVNSPPAPSLPAPASTYLNKVMPLPTWANVADEPLLVREGPSTDLPFFATLYTGNPVNVIAFSEDGKWSQIKSPYEGWVSNDFLLFVSESATQARVRLNVQPLRARYELKVLAEPKSGAAETATLSTGELVVVAAEIAPEGGNSATWYQIAEPMVGWVAAGDLTATTP
jgi:hypothetical protein